MEPTLDLLIRSGDEEVKRRKGSGRPGPPAYLTSCHLLKKKTILDNLAPIDFLVLWWKQSYWVVIEFSRELGREKQGTVRD